MKHILLTMEHEHMITIQTHSIVRAWWRAFSLPCSRKLQWKVPSNAPVNHQMIQVKQTHTSVLFLDIYINHNRVKNIIQKSNNTYLRQYQSTYTWNNIINILNDCYRFELDWSLRHQIVCSYLSKKFLRNVCNVWEMERNAIYTDMEEIEF